MSYYGRYQDEPRGPRADQEKAWNRAKATAWDEKWQALSVDARRAYLLDIKAPTKEGALNQGLTTAANILPEIAEELGKAGFIVVQEASGRKVAKLVALRAAYDFSSRIRSIHRFELLGASKREELIKYIWHTFYSRGEILITRVLEGAGIMHFGPIEEGLELYVTTRRWPDWAASSCKSKAVRPVLEALIRAPGPVPLAKLAGLVRGVKPAEVGEALSELIAHLAAYEGVDPDLFEIVVGLLPSVRKGLEEADKPSVRPPLVACEHPKEIGPPGGLEINDLRVFLLEISSESPKVRRDGGIFQKDEDRLIEVMPPHPEWLDALMRTSTEYRVSMAYSLAKLQKFVEFEEDGKTRWLRISGKGKAWLASGFEEQYGRIYDYYRSIAKKNPPSYEYDYSYGDSKFLGIPVSVSALKAGNPQYYSYYDDIKPEQRDALRAGLYRAFQALPPGIFHRWDSVLAHSSFGDQNPLLQGGNLDKLAISVDRRQIARLPEQVEKAARDLLDRFLILRLLPLDAVRPAIDGEGKLCIARLPRLDGYFGRPYDPGEDTTRASTRVIVQPDFSVLVIGMDPGPAAELAPFCERTGAQVGQGVMTFKITRGSVIRAASQGLSASAMLARLKKHASVDVPENILKEVVEWADWVRLVNVRTITAVRCPDEETVSRVVSALGKKAERLGDTLVALSIPHLTSFERQKLQEQGILVTKVDITLGEKPGPSSKASPSTSSAKKKRGRPRKVK